MYTPYVLFLESTQIRDVLFEFYLKFGNTTSAVLVFQLEVYYMVDRLLTGPTAQQKGTTTQWYSNKTSLYLFNQHFSDILYLCV